MGLGAKVGLATALLALLVVALAVLPGMKGGGDDDRAFNEAGAASVTALAAVEPGTWSGTGPTQVPGEFLKKLRSVLEKLFGERGREWVDQQVRDMRKVDKEADEDERREQAKRALKFEEELERLEKESTGSVGDPAGRAKAILARACGTFGSFEVAHAWVRESHKDNGRMLVSTIDENLIQVNLASAIQVAPSTAFYADGTLNGAPVRVFGRRAGQQGSTMATVYVALFRKEPASSGGGNTIGLLMLLVAPLLVGFVGYAVANGSAQSMRGLAREIERLGTSGDPGRSLRVEGTEAAAVARAVEHMVGNLEFRQQHAPAAPKGGAPQPLGDLGEIVERERNVAREIHDALINKHPPRLSDFEVEHLFKPGFEIGGDHFEYFRIDDEHLGVILLDTNVRGIPAALVIASARSYVRAAAPGNLSPAAVLKQVNRHLAGELPPGRHVTAVYAVIDTAQGKATMASAGHLPVLVFRQASGKIAKINPAGIAMGLDVGPVFDRELQEGDVPLGPGDRLVLYTDGALRIANENGEEFGEQRFYAAVAREAPKNSQAFVNFVGSAIDQFHLTTPQNDDVTISTVKRLR
jgi:hypothetical protein